MNAICFLLDNGNFRRFRMINLPEGILKSKIMEVKIKNGEEMIDATIEMVDGVMVVSPKVEKYMYKEGDVIIVRSQYKHILIYKESKNRRLYSFADLIDDLLDIDETPVCLEDDIKEIRPATEEEKQKLFDKLKEEGWEWNAEKKEVVKIKWKPKLSEVYYHPLFYKGCFNIRKDMWVGSILDMIYYDKCWFFKTEEECQPLVDKLNQAIEGVKP